jgi:CBS domain-containing protein
MRVVKLLALFIPLTLIASLPAMADTCANPGAIRNKPEAHLFTLLSRWEDRMSVSVKAILDAKGRNVVTTGGNTTLAEAAKILSENRIGAIVVVGMAGKISGIFTERDVVNAVAKHGPDSLNQPIASLMTAKVHRCKEDSTTDELMELMTHRRFRHVPVEDKGKLTGIISIGDVVKWRIREIEIEAEQIKAYIAG